jgi:chemotaxis protein MotB
MSGSGSNRPEIVIVRRKAADDGMQGKGGSWKIAYADFVTAMMAFFLVMWLINASNEEIKAQVANYFNPIQLTDSTTGARSIRDTTDVETAKVKDLAKNGQSGEAASKQAGETAILANPPLALDLIESKSAGGMESGAKVGTSDDLTPASNTKKSAPGVGDPFDPKSWEKASPPVPPPGAGSPDKNDGAAEGQPQDAAAQKKSSELSKAEKASGKQAAGTNAEDANLSEGELLKKYGEQADIRRDRLGPGTCGKRPQGFCRCQADTGRAGCQPHRKREVRNVQGGLGGARGRDHQAGRRRGQDDPGLTGGHICTRPHRCPALPEQLLRQLAALHRPRSCRPLHARSRRP